MIVTEMSLADVCVRRRGGHAAHLALDAPNGIQRQLISSTLLILCNAASSCPSCRPVGRELEGEHVGLN